ncbi:MAG: PAS domain-containing protein [Microvirga sp.]
MIDRSDAPETGGPASARNDDDPLASSTAARILELEEALRQSREMLRLAMAAGHLGTWERDIETGEMRCSPDYLANLGLPPEASLTFDQLVSMRHPDDVERVNRTVDHAIATRSDYDVSYRVVRPDGTIAKVVAKGRPIFENGSPTRMVGVTMDVTAQESAQEALQAAHHQQEFLLGVNDQFRDIEDPFAVMDAAVQALGRHLDAERVGFGEVDRDTGEIRGREWVRGSEAAEGITFSLDAFGPAIARDVAAGRSVIVDDLSTDPRTAHGSAKNLGFPDVPRTSESPGSPEISDPTWQRSAILIPLTKGVVLGALLYVVHRSKGAAGRTAVVAEDLAERTWNAVERSQVEINLRESEARLRTLAETLPALVWIISPDLKLAYANARWATFAGLPDSEALGFSWMEVMHPDDVARLVGLAPELRRDEAPISLELRYRDRTGLYRWHTIRAEPIHDARGGFRGWSGTSLDIHDLKQTEEALRRNATQLRIALQAAHMGVWSWDTTTDLLNFSDRAAEIFGLAVEQSLTWKDLQRHISPRDVARAAAAMEESFKTGGQYNIEYRVLRPGQASEAWVAVQGQVTYDPDGTVSGLTGVVQDISDRKAAEERQHLLIRELHHRVKNTLATVQAIVGSTARTASSIEEFYQGFVGRIVSLARTHNLLTEDLWQKASLKQLVQTELGPYDDDNRNRILIEGPDIELPSEAAVPIGMAIHELTTNAAKHGALSTFGGQVDVRWSLDTKDDKPMMRFEWTEHGGPRVLTPTRQGFGSRLLQRVLTTQLQADVNMDFNQDGLRFTMIMPIPGSPPLFNPDR